jgi:hypothetical protein
LNILIPSGIPTSVAQEAGNKPNETDRNRREREETQLTAKISKDEQERIKLHRKVARTIPTKRQPKSLEGQTYFDFKDSIKTYAKDPTVQLLPLDASCGVDRGLSTVSAV